jgi:hypothetical protein
MQISNICGTDRIPQFPYRTRNMTWILQLETIWDKTIAMDQNPAAAVVRTNIILITSPTFKKGEYFTYQSGHRIWLQKICYTSWSLSFKPTSHHIRGHVWRHFEVIIGKTSIPVNQEKTGNKKNIKRTSLRKRSAMFKFKRKHTFPFFFTIVR